MRNAVCDFQKDVDTANGDIQDFTIGSFNIVRNTNDLFDVYHLDKLILQDLLLLSAAVAISTLLEVSDYASANQILFLEQKFAKHYADMRFYENVNKIDMASNAKLDAEWCLVKIQTYVLPAN